MTLKLVDNRNASKWHAEKIKVDSLYEETPKQFLTYPEILSPKAKTDPKLGYQ